MITSETKRITEVMLNTKHKQAASEALMNRLMNSYATVSVSLKEGLYRNVESVLTEITCKIKLDDLFAGNLE